MINSNLPEGLLSVNSQGTGIPILVPSRSDGISSRARSNCMSDLSGRCGCV